MAKAKIEVTDHEPLGYQLLREPGQDKRDQALAELERASEAPDKLGATGAASVFYQLAILYLTKNDWAKAVDLYQRVD